MKVAVQISGQQRYGNYLKDFLAAVSIFDEVDIFVHNWHNNKDHTEVISFIDGSHSFQNVHVRRVAVLDQIQFEINPQWRLREGAPIFNLVSMTFGINAVNRMRQLYEQAQGKYDLVIRTRSDLKLIDFPEQTFFEDIAEGVIIVGNRPSHLDKAWHKEAIQDQIAICRPNTMNIYADLVNNFDTFHAEGNKFHPELYFYWWLKNKSNLTLVEEGFGVELDERNAGNREARAIY